jgi:integrase
MPKVSRTGIKGLYIGEDGRARIDLRYREPTTGRQERYQEQMPDGTTKAAAKLRAGAVLNAAMAGTLVKRGHEKPETFGAAFDRYLDFCKTNASGRSDPKYKERHRKAWVATLGEGFALAGFSELTIERHKKRRREQGKKPGTINRELVTLKHFLNKCVAWGWLPKRPAVTLLQEPPPRVRWLTDEERGKLAAELGKPQRQAFRRLCSAALLSGQRLGKLIGLARSDVDFDAGELTIRNMAKGGKLKTTHVPISAELEGVLREAMHESKATLHPERHQLALRALREGRRDRGLPLPRPAPRLRHETTPRRRRTARRQPGRDPGAARSRKPGDDPALRAHRPERARRGRGPR